MKRQFEEETAKPLCKRDFEKIEQLTADMSELFDDNDNLDGISKLYSRIDKLRIQKSIKIRIVKRLIPVACCGIIMLAANFISVTAWDMNIQLKMILLELLLNVQNIIFILKRFSIFLIVLYLLT